MDGTPVGDRGPGAVGDDVAAGRITVEEASRVYGVVVSGAEVDGTATSRRRASMLKARLRRAMPAATPVRDDVAVSGDALPLYPGVVQRGRVAFAAESGAPLAVAPDHWTDGCPVLEERRPTAGATIVERAYLDPTTGRFLYVEAVPEGTGRSFTVGPARFA